MKFLTAHKAMDTAQFKKAHAAFLFKQNPRNYDCRILGWLHKQKVFEAVLNAFASYAEKGYLGPERKLTAEIVKKLLCDYDLHPNFSADELLLVLEKYSH